MTETKLDFKKEYKDLYLPKNKPALIDVPEMMFIAVKGMGDPNGDCYQNAVGALYALSYTIKMSYKAGVDIPGYLQYVVPPLEGLWWMQDAPLSLTNLGDRNKWQWLSMIRQPDFVTEDVFAWAKDSVAEKKPDVDASAAQLITFTEGLCVQMMHIGPYATEPATVEAMQEFMEENGYSDDVGLKRKHHEIYLGDPRKTAPEKLKTVLRHPVRKA